MSMWLSQLTSWKSNPKEDKQAAAKSVGDSDDSDNSDNDNPASSANKSSQSYKDKGKHQSVSKKSRTSTTGGGSLYPSSKETNPNLERDASETEEEYDASFVWVGDDDPKRRMLGNIGTAPSSNAAPSGSQFPHLMELGNDYSSSASSHPNSGYSTHASPSHVPTKLGTSTSGKRTSWKGGKASAQDTHGGEGPAGVRMGVRHMRFSPVYAMLDRSVLAVSCMDNNLHVHPMSGLPPLQLTIAPKLREGEVLYDACFEREVLEQARQERQNEEEQAKRNEEVKREVQRRRAEEAKRMEESAFSAWATEQQLKHRQPQQPAQTQTQAQSSGHVQQGQANTTVNFPRPHAEAMSMASDGEGKLIDVSFPSPRISHLRHSDNPQPSHMVLEEEDEAPPPYPGPPTATPSTASTSSSISASTAPTTPFVNFPAPPPGAIPFHGAPMGMAGPGFMHYPVAHPSFVPHNAKAGGTQTSAGAAAVPMPVPMPLSMSMPMPMYPMSMPMPVPAAAPPRGTSSATSSSTAASSASNPTSVQSPPSNFSYLAAPYPVGSAPMTNFPRPPYMTGQPPAHYLPTGQPPHHAPIGAYPAPVVYPHPHTLPRAHPGHLPNAGHALPGPQTARSTPGGRNPTAEDFQKQFAVLANPEKRALFSKLVERRVRPELAAMALEINPSNDLNKLATFIANYAKLIELGFDSSRSQQALLLHEDADLQRVITYLKEMDKLLGSGYKEAEIFDACSLFDNDIAKAATFLEARKTLSGFGFPDVRVREALLLCDNNQEKAAQYLMIDS